MRLSTFKALFKGLLIAADFDGKVSAPVGTADESWPSLWLDVAQHCAAGQKITSATHGDTFRQVSQGAVAPGLLGALPVLLLNVDRYAHRQAYVSQWARDLELPESSVAALEELFGYLCQFHDIDQATDGLAESGYSHGQQKDFRFSTPILAASQHLVSQTQGQLGLTLQLARRRGWDCAALGLATVLIVVERGEPVIPLSLRHRLWDPPVRQNSWSSDNWQQLLALSYELYCRWSGVNLGNSLHLTQPSCSGKLP